MLDNFSSYIQEFHKGNHLIFEKIYQELSPKMYGICLRYASDKDEAKDILQDSFIKIYHQIKTFRNEGSFEGWSKKIVVNTALEYYKNKIKWQNVSLNVIEDVFEVENDDDILSDLSFQEMLLLVQELPPTYRLVFNLYVFDGMKHREIAKILCISEGTSKSNLFDARRILQKKLSGILKLNTSERKLMWGRIAFVHQSQNVDECYSSLQTQNENKNGK